jgi:anti-sigma regulatory factor (Ser/Thr protein kinase)
MLRRSQEFVSELPHLAAMRRFVGDCCREAWADDVPPEVLDQIHLALQEAAANVVFHAYGNEPGQPIRLEVAIDEDAMELVLTHDGKDFDPAAVPPPKYDGSRTGGFGVHLIRQLMDEVEYLHGDGRCGVRMVKRRPGRPEA